MGRACRTHAGCLVRSGRRGPDRRTTDSVPAVTLRGRGLKSGRGGSGAPRSAPSSSHVASARRGHGASKSRFGCGAHGAGTAGRSSFAARRARINAIARPGLHRPQRAVLAAKCHEFRAVVPAGVLHGPPIPAPAPTRCQLQAADDSRRILPAGRARFGAVPSDLDDVRDQDSVRTQHCGAAKSHGRFKGPLAPCALSEACRSRLRLAPCPLRGRGKVSRRAPAPLRCVQLLRWHRARRPLGGPLAALLQLVQCNGLCAVGRRLGGRESAALSPYRRLLPHVAQSGFSLGAQLRLAGSVPRPPSGLTEPRGARVPFRADFEFYGLRRGVLDAAGLSRVHRDGAHARIVARVLALRMGSNGTPVLSPCRDCCSSRSVPTPGCWRSATNRSASAVCSFASPRG